MEKNGGMRQRLRVGDEIQIPFPKPKEKAPAKPKVKVWAPSKPKDVYVVQSGDNLYSISKKLGVTVSDLQKWNNKGTSNNIYPGEKLKLNQSHVSNPQESASDYHVVEKGSLFGILQGVISIHYRNSKMEWTSRYQSKSG